MSAFDRPNSILARYSDLLLAGAVVIIIATMIVKVPQGVMDYLIAINIGISVTILLAALYMPDASRFPSFPTILLLTTLFRLALNVGTTKLILLDADAGEIINAFGNFVVQGNFVVGGVVFLVLVLVQFIVITKGSERVAEVAARFTLDAMPGKQMSIDAEQRSGSLSPEEARTKRQDLERESKLYGAMDGAMKFVKGDAIAGICISLVNIIGGLIIGVTQQGMSVGESAQVFSLLTIGDGLVSQIPSLLISIAAGLVVTRVAADSDDKSSHAAGDIIDQVLGQRKAVVITSLLLFGLAVLGASGATGLPPLPFLVLGAVLLGSLLLQWATTVREASRGGGGSASRQSGASGDGADAPTAPTPLTLALHPALGPALVPPDRPDLELAFRARLDALRQELIAQTGVPFPEIALQLGGRHVPEGGYAILAYDAVLDVGRVDPAAGVVLCDVQTGQSLGGRPLTLGWTRQHAVAVPAEQVAMLKSSGMVAMSPTETVVQHLRQCLHRHAAELVGVQEVSDLLENLKLTHAELVRAVTPTLLSIQQIVEVLRGLLREQVPIRDLRTILESLAHRGQRIKEPDQLLPWVRRDLRRTLCDRFAADDRQLEYYTLDPRIEQLFDGGQQRRPLLTPQDRRLIAASVKGGMDWSRRPLQLPVLVVATWQARHQLRDLLTEQRIHDVAVMAHEEFSPEFSPRPVGHVRWLGDDDDEANGDGGN